MDTTTTLAAFEALEVMREGNVGLPLDGSHSIVHEALMRLAALEAAASRPHEGHEEDAVDRLEESYMRGRKEMAMSVVRGLMPDLELDGDAATCASLSIQIVDAKSMLRNICDDHGDNDWQDDLHLVDILGKHLHDHLEA